MKSGLRLYVSALLKAAVSSVTPSPLAPYHITLRYVALDARGVVSYHVWHCGPVRTAGRGGAPDCAAAERSESAMASSATGTLPRGAIAAAEEGSERRVSWRA